MKFIVIIFLISVFQSFPLEAQNIIHLKERNNQFVQEFTQQKVYIDFDKQYYFAGDQIWFKAYVVNAIDHRPDTVESTLFVELFDTKDLLLKREIIRIQKGYGIGDFSLPDSLTEGNYVIRAYTPWMLNFSGDFIFVQNFFIENPETKNYINRSSRRENRRINRNLEKKADEIFFDLYQEAGSLVYDLPGKITYHAYDGLGEGINVNAELIDGSGELVTKFETFPGASGRGVANFRPISGEKYSVRYDPPNGRSRNIPLRNINSQGYTLSVDQLSEKIEISIRSVGGSFKNPYLAIHTRGIIHAFEQITLYDGIFKKQIYFKDLSPGISVVSLFDEDANVLAERLFFIIPEKEKYISLQVSKTDTDALDIEIEASKWASDTIALSLSLSGFNSEGIFKPQKNIISELYLQSDITTLLKNPARFFDDKEDYRNELDLIMLTSDWERFYWNDIFEDNRPSVRFRRLNGFPVYGNIEPTEQSKEFDRYNFEVTLQIDDEIPLRSTYTNIQGDFLFDSIKENGEFEAEISVLGLDGSKPEYFELFPDILKNDILDMNMYFRKLPQSKGPDWQRISLPSRKEPSDRRKKISDNLAYHYGSADQIIYIREDDNRFKNMRDILKSRVPGLLIDGNRIIIRGTSSILLSNEPLLLVDGHQYNSIQFLNLSPLEISHIEIFKGSSTSIFGVRGANGAIVAHSRRSSIAQRIIFEYILSGYYTPRNFSETLTGKTPPFSDHPSYQHTIHWEPYVKFDQNGKKNIRLSLPDQVEELHFIMEGVDLDGKIIHYHKLLDL